MSVRIGFSTSKTSLVSRVVRWLSNSKTSHCFFVTEAFGAKVMIEAHWNGLRVLDFEQWLRNPDNLIIALIEPRVDLTKGFEALVPYLGQPYDFGGLFGMVFVYIGRWFKQKWNNPWDSHKALFCSESVAQVLTWAQYPGWTAKQEMVSPDDLYDFFKNAPIRPPMP
jgi:hypothetical protein